jgi:hypothetical protein
LGRIHLSVGKQTVLTHQIDFPLLQSKSTTLHPLVEEGSVNPVLLQGMMMVDAFIWYVGGRFGTCVKAKGTRASIGATIFLQCFTLVVVIV